MCGICGIYSEDPGQRAPKLLEEMSRQLSHRGPDGAGAYCRQAIALGHRRLAIIDLQTGDQPLGSEDGAVQVVFNGEIYNYQALRRELEPAGHRFQTSSDTEVIAHGYEQWGDQVLEHLDGMFALAIWDGRQGRLLLARDRVGKKPLYYHWRPGLLLFASEIKALLAHPALERQVDEEALPAYLTYGHVPAPATWYVGVRQLLPGHLLALEPGRAPAARRWWQLWRPYAAERLRIGEREAVAELRRLVRAAVERRLIADVPLGAFLSGGLDSTIVVAEMAALLERPVQTFSIGFSGGGWYDESPYARLAAQHFGAEHHPFMVEPDAAGLIDALVSHYDEPFADSSALPTYLLSQLTRRHVTVALSGDGGDELFAGYERFGAGLWAERYQRVPRPLRSGVEALLRGLPAGPAHGLPARLKRVSAKLALPLAEGFPRWLMLFTPEELGRLLRRPQPLRPEPSERFATLRAEGAVAKTLPALLYYNLVTYLPDDLLVKADRMSMAHGLEVRSPFLDQALLEFVARLPARFLWRGRRGKHILRKAYRELLPRTLLARPKHGFGVPLDRWFRDQLRPLLQETLLAPDARLTRWLDQAALAALCADHWSGRRDLGHQLWALLTLERWLAAS